MKSKIILSLAFTSVAIIAGACISNLVSCSKGSGAALPGKLQYNGSVDSYTSGEAATFVKNNPKIQYDENSRTFDYQGEDDLYFNMSLNHEFSCDMESKIDEGVTTYHYDQTTIHLVKEDDVIALESLSKDDGLDAYWVLASLILGFTSWFVPTDSEGQPYLIDFSGDEEIDIHEKYSHGSLYDSDYLSPHADNYYLVSFHYKLDGVITEGANIGDEEPTVTACDITCGTEAYHFNDND